MYYKYLEDTGCTPRDWLDLFEQSEHKVLQSDIDMILRDAAREAASR